MGRNATLRRERKRIQKVNLLTSHETQLPRPWKGPDYGLTDFAEWVRAMYACHGRGIVTYYFGKMPTCYLLGSHSDIGPVERLMLATYDPEVQYICAVPSAHPKIVTPEAYSEMPFVVRIAELADEDFKILVPKSNHIHPGMVFR